MLVNNQAKVRRQAVILAVVLGLLQVALVPNFGIGSGRADLCLVYVACMCMGGDSQRAPFYGFFAGLFYDLTTTGPIGLMALILTVVGWGLSLAGQTKASEDLGPALAIFAPVAGIVNVVYALVLLAFGLTDGFIAAIFFHALPATILDIISFAIVAFVMSRSGGSGSGINSGRHAVGKTSYTMKRGL